MEHEDVEKQPLEEIEEKSLFEQRMGKNFLTLISVYSFFIALIALTNNKSWFSFPLVTSFLIILNAGFILIICALNIIVKEKKPMPRRNYEKMMAVAILQIILLFVLAWFFAGWSIVSEISALSFYLLSAIYSLINGYVSAGLFLLQMAFFIFLTETYTPRFIENKGKLSYIIIGLFYSIVFFIIALCSKFNIINTIFIIDYFISFTLVLPVYLFFQDSLKKLKLKLRKYF